MNPGGLIPELEFPGICCIKEGSDLVLRMGEEVLQKASWVVKGPIIQWEEQVP